jgi:glycosyltransferase involved in cell wall biosynthesis
MRIVIDMQGVQAKSCFRGISRYSLSLAVALARNADAHEVWLVLNAAFQNSILDIRRAFAGVISEKRIRVFEVPTPIAEYDPENAWRVSVAGKIREHFILGLKPDILLVTHSLSAGWFDDVVSTGSSRSDEPKTCVLLHENISSFLDAAKNNDPTHYKWRLRKLQSLKKASLIIATSETNRIDAIVRLGLDEKQVITIEYDQENGDSNVAALRVINACQSVYQQTEKDKCEKIHSINFQGYRPRLAFISPLPPEKTGIADYSAELLPELARYYNIELVTDHQEVSDLWPGANFPIRSVAWFKLNQDRYERVLYHFGNSIFHRHMFGLLNEVPGVVVLHDFFLSHVMAGMDLNGYQQFVWTDALFQSHGYAGLQQRFQVSEPENVIWRYPCNLGVLQSALGVIVHAQNSQRLASQWYGGRVGMDWAVIPHLRVPVQDVDRIAARRALNLSEDNFIVCSFGMLGPVKLNQRLLDAWLLSSLSKNKHCMLVFAGENHEGNYGAELLKTIKKSGLEKRIYITGWADTAIFRQYLAAADIGVQLRTLSRGETSGTVLDCMNYGLPTIVNANGSITDLPRDAVWMLPDDFTDAELVDALETLWQDDERRNQLASRSREVILTQHDPGRCANQYTQAIESIYRRTETGQHALVKAIAALENLPSEGTVVGHIAKSIAASFSPEPSQRQLLIDVSSIVRHDLKSGIERVVRAQLMELIKDPPGGFRVEPVYLTDQGGQWHYRYARSYTCKMLGIEQVNLFDAPIDLGQGDVFYGLDFFPDGVINAAKTGIYSKWKAAGLSINFLVYDLLPVLRPEFFPDGAGIIHAKWLKTIAEFSSRLICISNSIANELYLWLENNMSVRKDQLLIGAVHLGADIIASAPSTGLLDNAKKVLKTISETPTFVMVGTIEPRKGYLQTLAAFELLWEQEKQINLVIVGKEGWKPLPNSQRRTIPQIVEKLRKRKGSGDHLFWLEGISDEYLEKIYAASTCLIAASECEGFGLPLIEAAQHKLPIIARDIPVFREVAGEHAYYFSGGAPENLASAVTRWLKMYQEGNYPKSETIPWLSWKESASQVGVLLGNSELENPSVHAVKLLILKPRRRLYVDISVVFHNDFKTGIQRVVRAVLSELIKNPPVNYTICPVYLANSSGTWDYYPVPSYSPGGEFTPISPGGGDVLLGLDFAGSYVVSAFREGLYLKLMDSGMLVYFVVYDLLPVLAPQFFSTEATKGHEQWLRCICQSDGVICISKSVADELSVWSHTVNVKMPDSFSIKFFHLGGDLAESVPTSGIPDNAESTLNLLSLRPSFLMVGTVEPRKGHTQLLAAFEKLCDQGIEVNLVIVGQVGWKMESFIDRLRHHTELGKRLFWLEGISDEYLDKIYAASTCLVAASEGEGFGLPLIEAAQHKLPIIARDIPVFREVAGEHAYYFNGLDPQVLADAIKHWLILRAEDKAPQSDNMHWLTWNQSAQQLLNVIIPKVVTINTDR